MGRELQKRKNRSSISKVKHKPKSKKKLLHNPIIAANWDHSQTLSQNYRRLGLTAKLNKSTGGVEKTATDVAREADGRGEDKRAKGDSLKIIGQKGREPKLDTSEVQVERDPETGAIIRVFNDGDSKTRPNPLNDPLNDVDSDDDDDDDDDEEASAGDLSRGAGVKTDVVQQLEYRANLPEKKHKRRQTEAEIAFIEELVRKYGDDVPKMARDLKINYMQRSEGDLRQRIKRWKESGGSV